MPYLWNRRDWLTRQMLGLAVLTPRVRRDEMGRPRRASQASSPWGRSSERLDPAPWEALAQRAVDAAHAAGAQYADAHLTRVVKHLYNVRYATLEKDEELLGVGVRALVGGAWGYSASTVIMPDEVVRLAQDAVGQATVNSQGAPRWSVELGTIPAATGRWTTPVQIDPFTVPIEEKEDFIKYWFECASRARVKFELYGQTSYLLFVRREQVVATSQGSLFTQTLFESGGELKVIIAGGQGVGGLQYGKWIPVHGLELAGAGWELCLEAKIAEQFLSGQIPDEVLARNSRSHRPMQVGKYTLVCDGATMAKLVQNTLGVATQLDRALGYEANASGTGWFDDPLTQVGHAQVTAPLVTLTANRSTPRELATVKWDAEGVAAPAPFPLIQDGVLVDFQTTREQAAWLAPYYQQRGWPVASHGCAMAESAHFLPLQQLPNLAMAPGHAAIQVSDLVANVANGILVEGCKVEEIDSQARTGLLKTEPWGAMREIKNGKIGREIDGGAVRFDSQQLWGAVKAIGGPATEGTRAYSPDLLTFANTLAEYYAYKMNLKGQPGQTTSHSMRAVAATIADQPVIDPLRKA